MTSIRLARLSAGLGDVLRIPGALRQEQPQAACDRRSDSVLGVNDCSSLTHEGWAIFLTDFTLHD